MISHCTVTPETISHFTAPSIGPYQLLINAKIHRKDHHQGTAARADTNQCHRHVLTDDMAKGIQITRLMSSNTTHSTNSQQSIANSSPMTSWTPIFMVPPGWQCQGRVTVGKVSKFEC
jgi:hypothetical protein